jgi:hypothetical protein
MRFRIRRLRIQIITERGTAGADFAFPDGLIVLQSVNTVGKSSVLNAILYALGLEGMLGPSHDVPLPHAFTDWIELEGENYPVLECRVLLEIEGAVSQPLTVESIRDRLARGRSSVNR